MEALVGSVAEDGADGGPAGTANWVQVISAFDVPKILYDPIRKSFYRAPQPTSLLGTAEVRSQHQLYLKLAGSGAVLFSLCAGHGFITSTSQPPCLCLPVCLSSPMQ